MNAADQFCAVTGCCSSHQLGEIRTFSTGGKLYEAALTEALMRAKGDFGPVNMRLLQEEIYFQVNSAAVEAGLDTSDLERVAVEGIRLPKFQFDTASAGQVGFICANFEFFCSIYIQPPGDEPHDS